MYLRGAEVGRSDRLRFNRHEKPQHAVGSREHQAGPDWGEYTVDEAAARHGASVERNTSDSSEAYAGLKRPKPTRFRADWLPEL